MVAVTLVVAALVALGVVVSSSGTSRPRALAFSPSLDPGTPLPATPAPDFTLTDQFDRPVSLSSFRGKVVLLAFNDSECTTICPLTTTAMVDAQRMLGSAGSEVALLGVDANPHAISVSDVRSYSELHGMTHAWHFTTGSSTQLHRVWKAYHVDVEIQAGQIDHTPALFLISPRGTLERLYLTQMSYSSVSQEAQILARAASKLLPDHPAVHSALSYRPVKGITPTQRTTLPLVNHGSLTLGPGSPRLLLFFASWDQEVMDLKSHLQELRAYARGAAAAKVPPLVAVDEGSVEPSASALPRLIAQLHTPLPYPVAIDKNGRVADGYGVQDEPWLVLVSATGTPLWYQDVATAGWPTQSGLVSEVKAALRKTSGPPTTAVVKRELAGSPPLLAALHAQSDQLIGGIKALKARIRSLHGVPIVLNFWYSTCPPCRAEFGLLASASAQFGRRVAFLGADVSDPGDPAAFLKQHPVSYPSYPISLDNVTAVLPQGLGGTPTTVFYDAAGRVHVHTGQYKTQGSLDLDINNYALGG